MRLQRFYFIIKTVLHYGLDELLPAQQTPWLVKGIRRCFFWLSNQLTSGE